MPQSSPGPLRAAQPLEQEGTGRVSSRRKRRGIGRTGGRVPSGEDFPRPPASAGCSSNPVSFVPFFSLHGSSLVACLPFGPFWFLSVPSVPSGSVRFLAFPTGSEFLVFQPIPLLRLGSAPLPAEAGRFAFPEMQFLSPSPKLWFNPLPQVALFPLMGSLSVLHES